MTQAQPQHDDGEPDARCGGMAPRLVLASVTACIGMGQSSIYIILPPLARTIGLSEIETGAIVSASAVIFALASSCWGRMIDRYGARRVLLIGLLGYSAGTVGFGLAAEASTAALMSTQIAFYALALSRMIHAAIGAGSYPAAMTVMAGITPPQQRTSGMAALGAGFNTGLLAGPAICALAAPFGFGFPLFAMALMSVATMLLCSYLIQAQQTAPARSSDGAASGAQWLLILSVLQFGVISGMQQVIGFMFQDRFSLSPLETVSAIGVALGVTAICSLAVQGALSRAPSLDPANVLDLGFVCVLLGLLLIGFGASQWIASAGIIAMGVGNGLTAAGINGRASLIAGARQGAVAGRLGSARALGFIIGPIGMTTAYQSSAILPFLIGSLLIAAMLCGNRFRDKPRLDLPPK
jgi:MFS family permease